MKRKIVLASHGGLASGLYDTAKMIVGKLPFDVDILYSPAVLQRTTVGN